MLDECAIRTVDLPRVDAVRAILPCDGQTTEVADTFSLLGDPARLKLLTALLEGEMCVCDLAAACRQGESAVSHALRLLRAARMVQVRRAGRIAFYRLADDRVRTLLDVAFTQKGHTFRRHADVSEFSA